MYYVGYTTPDIHHRQRSLSSRYHPRLVFPFEIVTDGLIINLMDRWNIIRIPIIVKDERKAIFDCLAYNTQERNEYLPGRLSIALRDLCDVSTTALSRMR